MQTASPFRLASITAALTLALLAWDLSGLDLALAGLSGGPAGFALRDHWLLTNGLHDGGRRLVWLAMLLLCLGVWWPLGALRRISLTRRLQLAATPLLAALAVSALKSASATSCPWDLAQFGGVARHASHWLQALQPDGGSGHCFPAGHASAGFSFLGGYFALRHDEPVLARRWLWAALGAGLVFGLGQQLRGAHFMSHTLWSAWICWAVAWMLDAAGLGGSGRAPAAPAPGTP